MTHEDFEKFICDWLDGREDAALRKELERAAGADERLARLLTEHDRLDAALRAAPAALDRVDWRRAAARFAQAAHSAADSADPTESLLGAASPDSVGDDALNRLLASGHVDAQVDWGRFAQHVRSAVAADRRNVRQRRLLTRLGAASALAAAAVLALVVYLRSGGQALDGGVATVRIVSFATAVGEEHVSVRISERPAAASDAAAAGEDDNDVYFSIDPLPAAPALAQLDSSGLF